MKRCTHPRLKMFTFKSGEIMTMCPDCKHGEGHEDQKTPILGRLYTRYPNAESVEPECTDIEDREIEPGEEELELVGQTFVTIEEENETPVESVEPEELDGEEIVDEVAEEV